SHMPFPSPERGGTARKARRGGVTKGAATPIPRPSAAALPPSGGGEINPAIRMRWPSPFQGGSSVRFVRDRIAPCVTADEGRGADRGAAFNQSRRDGIDAAMRYRDEQRRSIE